MLSAFHVIGHTSSEAIDVVIVIMSLDPSCQLMIAAPTHNLLDLPEEVLSIVFRKLPSCNDVLALAISCRRLRDIAYNQVIQMNIIPI